MIASNIGHGTTAAISARNTSRFVRFFLLASAGLPRLSVVHRPAEVWSTERRAPIGRIDCGTPGEYARLVAGAVRAFVLALAAARFDIGHRCGAQLVRADLWH